MGMGRSRQIQGIAPAVDDCRRMVLVAWLAASAFAFAAFAAIVGRSYNTRQLALV